MRKPLAVLLAAQLLAAVVAPSATAVSVPPSVSAQTSIDAGGASHLGVQEDKPTPYEDPHENVEEETKDILEEREGTAKFLKAGPIPMHVSLPLHIAPGTSYPIPAVMLNWEKKITPIEVQSSVHCNVGGDSPGPRRTYSPPRTFILPPSTGANPSVLTIAVPTLIPEGCQENILGHSGTINVMFAAPGKKSYGGGFTYLKYSKKFSQGNFRSNLQARTPAPDLKKYQAHHVLPQKHAAKFAEYHVNIHDPNYGMWWCSVEGVPTNHQSQATAYNNLWEEWFVRLEEHTLGDGDTELNEMFGPTPSMYGEDGHLLQDPAVIRMVAEKIVPQFTYECPKDPEPTPEG